MLTNEPDEKLQYACCVDNVGRKPNMQYDPPPKKTKKTQQQKTHTHRDTQHTVEAKKTAWSL